MINCCESAWTPYNLLCASQPGTALPSDLCHAVSRPAIMLSTSCTECAGACQVPQSMTEIINTTNNRNCEAVH